MKLFRLAAGALLALSILGVMALSTSPNPITLPTPVAQTFAPQTHAPPTPTPAPVAQAPAPTTKPITPTATAQKPAPSPQPPAATPVCATPNGSLVTENIPDMLLAAALRAQVFLPPCYDRATRYPLLVLIHGTSYPFGGWVSKQKIDTLAGAAMRQGKLPPFIIVMPSSDVNFGLRSLYVQSDGGPGSYDDVIIKELLPFIENKYSVAQTPDRRAIGGISRGAYWALEIAFAHPDVFGAVGGHSPSTYSQLVGLPKSFSVLQYAKSVESARGLRIWLDAGDSDWTQADAKRLAGELKASDIPYEFSTGKGGHTDAYWAARTLDYLQFYARPW